MPLFSSVQDPTRPFHRVNFNRQLNSVSEEASKRLNKNVRSHSFCYTFITDLLRDDVPRERVRDIVRHSDISTTAKYNRSILTKKDLDQKTINSVQKARTNN